jgi:SAM-dependent methyltransferase
VTLCPACAAAEPRPWFRRADLEFRRCPECGSAALAGPDPRYDAAYFLSLRANSEAARAANVRALASLLRRFAPGPPGRLLDVGCGSGEFMAEAERGGWRVSGCDLPPGPGAEPLPATLAARVLRGAPERWRYDAASFDAVTAFGVLEHASDPGALLERISSWLRPGGIFLLITPSLSSASARLMGRYWPHFHAEHRTYFKEAALRSLLTRHGFAAASRFPWRKRVTLDFLLDQLERYYSDLGPGAAAALLRRLPARARSFPLPLPSGSVGFAAVRETTARRIATP